MIQNGKSRDDLAHEANAVRSKLMHAITQLERRRHEAADLSYQLRRHAKEVAAAGVVVLVIVAGAVGLTAARIATAASRRRRDRWLLVRSAWRRPDRVLRAERGPFYLEILRSLGVSILTVVLTAPVRRLVMDVLRRPRASGAREAGAAAPRSGGRLLTP